MHAETEYKFQHEESAALKDEAAIALLRTQWLERWEFVRKSAKHSVWGLLSYIVSTSVIVGLRASPYFFVFIIVMELAIRFAAPRNKTPLKDIKPVKLPKTPKLVTTTLVILIIVGLAGVFAGAYHSWGFFAPIPALILMTGWNLYRMQNLKRKMIKWGLIESRKHSTDQSDHIVAQLSKAEDVIDNTIGPAKHSPAKQVVTR